MTHTSPAIPLSKAYSSSHPATIRFARPDDIPALPAIERAAATFFRDSSYPFLAYAPLNTTSIDLSLSTVWVAVADADLPVGFALAQRLPESGHLQELDVHPHYARQGLGHRLIQTVAAWSRTQGYPSLTLITFADVPWNVPYYARLGFRCLNDGEIPPSLQAIRHAEAAAGLPMTHRICMQLDH